MLHSIWSAHRPALLWAVLTAILLLSPAPPIDESGPDWLTGILAHVPLLDKAVHGVLFLILAVLLGRSLSRARVGYPMLLAAGLAIAYGLLLEAAQGPVPGRLPEMLDAVADALGAVAGAILSGIEPTGTPRRERRPGLDGSGLDESR